MTTTMYFIFGVTLGAIPIMILWYRCDKDLKLVDNFTFTEKQKSIIKEIINLYYVPEDCDICNRYNKALKEARESNEQMFEEIEKIIRR